MLHNQEFHLHSLRTIRNHLRKLEKERKALKDKSGKNYRSKWKLKGVISSFRYIVSRRSYN